jgi:predicted ATP-binding protein involved in virulence
MIFRAKSFNFYFQRGDGYTFDLSTLADGHAAVLALLAEILLRIEAVQVARDDFTFNPDGVVIVDEIETHLHLKLQEQILPFMTELFPKLQLLVATHSPAVIASIPGAVVCDLGTREQAPSELYRGVPYGALMKEHFGLSSDIDLESTGWLLELRELATLDKRTPEQERRFDELARKLSARSAVLATEVWMIRNRIGGSHVQVGGQRS